MSDKHEPAAEVDIDDVRHAWVVFMTTDDEYRDAIPERAATELFDRWLRAELGRAWSEGHTAGKIDADDATTANIWGDQHTDTPNPYESGSPVEEKTT